MDFLIITFQDKIALLIILNNLFHYTISIYLILQLQNEEQTSVIIQQMLLHGNHLWVN